MRQSWLPSAAVLLCVGGAWAETPVGAPVIAPTLLEQPGRDAMPGAVISTLPTPQPAPAQPPRGEHAVAGCTTCSDGGHGHGSTLQCLRNWLCFQSHRPRQCTDTPTLYRPPLFTYFRCTGCNLQPHWPVDRCDPRLFQMGLPPDFPPPAGLSPPVAAAPRVDAAGAPSTTSPGADDPSRSVTPATVPPADPDKPRTQGPLMPGSAAAAAECACGTCASPAPAPVLKSASPYAIVQVGAKDNPPPGFRPVPVYIPSYPSRFDRR